MEYDQPIETETYFKKSRASTTNSKKTLQNYSRAKTTLPDDIHYDGEKLFRLFNKPNIMVGVIKFNVEELFLFDWLIDDVVLNNIRKFLFSLQVKRQEGGVETMDEAVDNYNYDNENDRENFCPAMEVDKSE